MRLFHRDRVVELLAWSRYAVRRLQNPVRRLGANTGADLRLVWPGPPLFIVDDAGASEALSLQARLWSPPQAQMNDRLHAALERMVRELALPADRLDAIVALVTEPYAPELVERIVATLDLPPEVASLVHEPETAEARGIAHTEPSGAVEQTLERQHLKRLRR